MRVRKWKRGEGWERVRGRKEGGRKRREKKNRPACYAHSYYQNLFFSRYIDQSTQRPLVLTPTVPPTPRSYTMWEKEKCPKYEATFLLLPFFHFRHHPPSPFMVVVASLTVLWRKASLFLISHSWPPVSHCMVISVSA